MSSPRRPGPRASGNVVAGDAVLHLTQYGGATASAPPVVLVHGFRGDHHGLETIAGFLARARPDLAILVPDLPGFGGSPALTRAHDLDGYVDALIHLLEAEGTPVVLAGHSFGSILAAHLTARRPDLVAGLALLTPITSDPLAGPRALASAATRAYYRLAAALPERAGRAFLAWPPIVRVMSEVMAVTRDPAIRAWIHDQHRRYFSVFASTRVVLEAFDTSVSHTVRDVEAELRDLPVLVVAGAADDIAPLSGQRAFARAVGARLVELPDVGHLVHYEAPDTAAAAIAGLVADVEGRR